MTSNSAQMSLEEKLVQHIKTTSFMLLIDDEDAITELTRRALTEALVQKRRVSTNSYGGYTEHDSPVVEAARNVATKALEKLMQDEIDKLLATPDTLIQLRKAMMMMLPKILEEKIGAVYQGIVQHSSNEALEILRNGGFIK